VRPRRGAEHAACLALLTDGVPRVVEVRASAAAAGSAAADDEPAGGPFGDQALGAGVLGVGERDLDVTGGLLDVEDDQRRSRHEALVVVPVQQLAVVLDEAQDLAAIARLQIGQRQQLAVLRALGLGRDRSAVRAAVRNPSRSCIRSIMSSVNESPSASACSWAPAGL
jgi:hypothetical protein